MTDDDGTEGQVGRHGDVAVVNGPEGALDWRSIDWPRVDSDVQRLRQRIFTASQAGDLCRVRNLQKLMLRSRANTLVSVRRVTELNAGRKTAGVDGKVVVTAPGKAELADWVDYHAALWKPMPVKRVYIPKANGKQRPLGVPVIVDRVIQARVVNALEPEWEARFEPKSYGFRPGRGCHDAIESIYKTVSGKAARRVWVLDADLAAAFDRIDHERLLSAVGTFPARGLIGQWLTAGVIDRGRFAPTGEGTPQGGVVSPLLLNVALHGMEAAAGVRYRTVGRHAGKTMSDSAVVVRYADDLVAMCFSRSQAEGQGAVGDMVGAERVGLQRGQDTCCPPRWWFRLFGVQRSSLSGQAVDQAIDGRNAANPGTARRRDEGPARGQRQSGVAATEPDHSGVVGLLPAGGVQQGVRLAGPVDVDAYLQVGQAWSPEQTEALGRRPVLRFVQQVPA